MSQGVILAVLGCGVGLGGAWGLGRFLQSRLFEMEANDPTTLASAVIVLLAAAAFAS